MDSVVTNWPHKGLVNLTIRQPFDHFMLPENLASDNPFFQENIADLTDLIMTVLQIQVSSVIDPFQDENSLYAFCMGFLTSCKHEPSKEMVETILIVKPFIQELLDRLDSEQSKA